MLVASCVLLLLLFPLIECGTSYTENSTLLSVDTRIRIAAGLMEANTSYSQIAPHINSDGEDYGAVVNYLPKCCTSGFAIKEGTCQKFPGLNPTLVTQNILRKVKSFTSDFLNATVKLSHSEYKNLECSRDFLRNLELKRSLTTPKFYTSERNETTFFLHFYQENYWDLEYRVPYYCVDLNYVTNLFDSSYEAQVFYCLEPTSISILYPILFYISSVGLMLTFLMYLITPAKGGGRTQKQGTTRPGFNTPRQPTLASRLTGRNLLCHITSLCLSFIGWAIVQQEIVEPQQLSCIAMGYINYALTIASFSWLTVYCFDYFWMFRASLKSADENKHLFLPYSLFGWGVPIALLIVAAVAQFIQSKPYSLMRSLNPNMGLLRCWFSNDTSASYLFYVPVILLLSLNVFFFTNLIFNPNIMNCRKGKRGSLQVRSTQAVRSDKDKLKKDLKMAGKLFFITGVPWIFEIAAWLPKIFGIAPRQLETASRFLYHASNLFNGLRGVVVFVLFVLLQRNVRAELLLRLRRITGKLSLQTESLTKDQTSTTFPSKNCESNHQSNMNLPTMGKKSSSDQSSKLVPSSKTKTDDLFVFHPTEITVL